MCEIKFLYDLSSVYIRSEYLCYMPIYLGLSKNVLGKTGYETTFRNPTLVTMIKAAANSSLSGHWISVAKGSQNSYEQKMHRNILSAVLT